MRLPRQRLWERSDHTDTGYSGQTGPDEVLSSAWPSEPPRSHQETERGKRTLSTVEYHFWWDCQHCPADVAPVSNQRAFWNHEGDPDYLTPNVGSCYPCDITGDTSSGAVQCSACKGATRENISIKEHLIKKKNRKKEKMEERGGRIKGPPEVRLASNPFFTGNYFFLKKKGKWNESKKIIQL